MQGREGRGGMPWQVPLLLLLCPLLQQAQAGCPRVFGDKMVLEGCVLPSGLVVDSDYGDVTDDATCTTCRDVTTNDVTAGFVHCRLGLWEGELRPCVGQTSVEPALKRPKRFIFLIPLIIIWALRSRDTTPPYFHCPPNIRQYSDPGQVNAKVYWDEPHIARDPDNGRSYPVERTSWRGPGWTFSGVERIHYKASDGSGNARTCSMTITVISLKCSKMGRLENGYVMCGPKSLEGNDEILAGGYCKFGCYEGYRLTGSSYIRCQKSGSWSEPPPACERVGCPTLSATAGTSMECTDSNSFLSVCTYHCQPGYDVREGESKVKVCGSGGDWLGSTPTCRDVEPPKLLNCQFYILAVANRGEDVAHVTWQEPIVVDNSQARLRPVLSGSVRPGMRLREDTYYVTYSARDHAGNIAYPCSMEIVVKVLKCPRLYGMANQDILCPDGLRYGSECSFSCRNYWLPEGANTSSCERVADSQYPYADWFWTSKPRCKPGPGCPSLKPPENGAVVCDKWKGGDFCQFQCREGTDVPPSLRHALVLNVCGVDRKAWSYLGPTPHCTAVKRSRHAGASSKVTYFHRDCQDEAARTQVRDNFVALLNSSDFQTACRTSQCSATDVQVLCGQNRSGASEGDVSSESNSTDVAETQMTILFNLVAMGNESEKDDGTFDDAADDARRFLATLQDRLQEVVAAVTESNNTNITAALEYEYPTPVCPPGSFPTYPQFACVKCSKGTYFSKHDRSCVPCPVGSYQDKTGQIACVTCPPHSTTLEMESGSPDDCIPLCRPGRFSVDGMSPCSPCPLGTFQQDFGAVECSPCPRNQGTTREGSKTAWDCKDFDARFPEHDNSTLELKRTLQLQSFQNLTMTFWLLGNAEANVDFLSIILGTNELRASLTTEKLLRIWLNGEFLGDIINLNSTRWRHVAVDLSTAHASVYVDGVEEVSSARSNFLHPVRQQTAEVNISIVLGGEGFWGRVTQLNIWTDSGTANLTDPPRCELALPGNVLAWRDFLQGDDKGSFFSLPTACDDTDECEDSPCNHGDCHDAKGGFLCTCHPGFTGWVCDVNIDDCAQHLCQHGATCVDGVQNYTCSCPSNYTGHFCDVQIVDGAWSDWGAWTPCSVTCDEGIRSRSRSCSAPYPENGGLECEGNMTETESCNMTMCPECPEVAVPGNATFSCEEEGTLRVCQLECLPGFDYDVMPAANYTCGLETSYVWSFENDENPDGRLPNCMPVEPADLAEVVYRASYVNLTCDDVFMEQEAATAVTSAVERAIKDIECSTSNRCEIKFLKITNCITAATTASTTTTTTTSTTTTTTAAPTQETKDVQNETSVTSLNATAGGQNDTAFPVDLPAAGFVLLLSNKPAEVGIAQGAEDLERAVATLRSKGEGGLFDLVLKGTHFRLDWESGRGSGSVRCPPGFVMSLYYCVPCGPGTKWVGGACEFCGRGLYQNETGQTDCQKCPEGWTTSSHASTGLYDCSIPLVEESQEVFAELNDNGFIVGAVVGSLLGLACLPLAVFLLRRGRFRMVTMGGSSGENSEIPEFVEEDDKTDNVLLLTFVPHDPDTSDPDLQVSSQH